MDVWMLTHRWLERLVGSLVQCYRNRQGSCLVSQEVLRLQRSIQEEYFPRGRDGP